MCHRKIIMNCDASWTLYSYEIVEVKNYHKQNRQTNQQMNMNEEKNALISQFPFSLYNLLIYTQKEKWYLEARATLLYFLPYKSPSHFPNTKGKKEKKRMKQRTKKK